VNIIGAADEFWRLRLTRVDTTEDLNFEWREDILYRETRQAALDELEIFQIEAVRLDDSDSVTCLARFFEREDAEKYLSEARVDLSEMTRAGFEDAYLAGDDELPPL
jgi:hypothetical protein